MDGGFDPITGTGMVRMWPPFPIRLANFAMLFPLLQVLDGYAGHFRSAPWIRSGLRPFLTRHSQHRANSATVLIPFHRESTIRSATYLVKSAP